MSHSNSGVRKMSYEEIVEILKTEEPKQEAQGSDLFPTVMAYFVKKDSQGFDATQLTRDNTSRFRRNLTKRCR